MGKITKTLNKEPKETPVIFLDQLEVGKDAHIKVMICRRWDVNTIYGKYMSTDFIVSDQRGNVIHCIAKNNIAHCFIDRLQDGCVYFMGNFTVQPNRDQFRILKDSSHIIELQGSTYVRKATTDVDGFLRYPFQCIDFEEIEPTFNEYYVDVIGCVTNVGKITPQKNGSTTLDFHLTNHRGSKIKVTLWGKLGEELLQKKSKSSVFYTIILTSMNAKDYKRKIQIYSIEAEHTEDPEDDVPILQVGPKEGTIEQLLQWAHHRKLDAVSFRCQVQITNVRTKNSWYYYTCSTCKCRKGVDRQAGHFWCQSCEKVVNFPRTRFKLQLDVKDESAQTVFIMFDETAEQLLNTTAQCLLDESNRDSNYSVLPNVIANLINTTHIFELRTHTYYEHATYQSFNCSNVYKAHVPTIDETLDIELDKLDETLDKDGFKGTTQGQGLSSQTKIKRDLNIATPAKSSELKKRRKYIAESSESEDDNDCVSEGNNDCAPQDKNVEENDG